MANEVTIVPACLKDASYVTGNMRERDRVEAMCQLPDGTRTHELAYFLIMNGEGYVAKLNGIPVMLFGVTPMTVCAFSVWALGTKDTWRVVSAVTKFMIPFLWEKHKAGFVTMEARSEVSHKQAHRWLRDTGAVAIGKPFVYGKNREKFLLFRWDADVLPQIAKRYKVPLE